MPYGVLEQIAEGIDLLVQHAGKLRFASEPLMLTCISMPSMAGRRFPTRSRPPQEARRFPACPSSFLCSAATSAFTARMSFTARCRASWSCQASVASANFCAHAVFRPLRARIGHESSGCGQGLAVDGQLDRVVPGNAIGPRGASPHRRRPGSAPDRHAQVPDQAVHAGLAGDRVVGYDLVRPFGRLHFLGRSWCSTDGASSLPFASRISMVTSPSGSALR